MTESQFPRAPMWRRFAAIIYDLLMVVAIYMLVNLISVGLFLILFANNLIDQQGFDHAIDLLHATWYYRLPLYLFNFGCLFVFLMWFYVNGGQTIGMRAWRMQIRSQSGQAISYRQAALRLISGIGGLGNVWILFNKDKRSLQDLVSDTEMLQLTKNANKFTEWKSL